MNAYTITLIVALAVGWYAFGILGFVYWWRSEDDFTTKELPLALCVGLVGPLAWVMGCSIYGPRVLAKKRTK